MERSEDGSKKRLSKVGGSTRREGVFVRDMPEGYDFETDGLGSIQGDVAPSPGGPTCARKQRDGALLFGR